MNFNEIILYSSVSMKQCITCFLKFCNIAIKSIYLCQIVGKQCLVLKSNFLFFPGVNEIIKYDFCTNKTQ